MTKWIYKYTNAIELKLTHKGKKRKPTFEERIEIAQYTIANALDYQQVRCILSASVHIVRKYQTGREEALQDNRGRKKPVEELVEHERLKLQIKELEVRNEYLKMENAFAKKLAESKRRNTS